jgi:nucleoid-associated protein YgaU
LAEAVVGGDGRWSLTVEKGLSPGEYKVRVDQVGENGKVLARAEVPFMQAPAFAAAPSAAIGTSAPRAMATPEPKLSAPAPSPAAPSPEPSATASAAPTRDAANPVVSALDTFEVKRGDNLWRISRRVYGQGVRYSTIYEANTNQIRNPDRIYPGQIFVMPPRT